MASSPDPLFRNGLEHYRKPAPASVWARVEVGLERKRRKSVWLKVAAGLCLLIAASTVLWQFNETDNAVAAVSKESAPVTLKPDTAKTIVNEEPNAILRESSVASAERSRSMSREVRAMGNSQHSQLNSIVERSRNNHADVVHKDLPVVERSRNEPRRSSRQSAVGSEQSAFSRESSVACTERSRSMSREVTHSPNETQLISMVETDELLATPASEIQIEILMEESVNEALVEQKGTSITYTSDEVNQKFLKKDLPTQATPEKKNASGLQKVIDKAVELTTDGTVYGELREKKNEWLSFNMLSNKTEANK